MCMCIDIGLSEDTVVVVVVVVVVDTFRTRVGHYTLAVPVPVLEERMTADAERVDVDLGAKADEIPEDLVADTHIKAAQVTVHPTVDPVHEVTLLKPECDTMFFARVQNNCAVFLSDRNPLCTHLNLI